MKCEKHNIELSVGGNERNIRGSTINTSMINVEMKTLKATLKDPKLGLKLSEKKSAMANLEVDEM